MPPESRAGPDGSSIDGSNDEAGSGDAANGSDGGGRGGSGDGADVKKESATETFAKATYCNLAERTELTVPDSWLVV